MTNEVAIALITGVPAIIAAITSLVITLRTKKAVEVVAKTVIETSELVRRSL